MNRLSLCKPVMRSGRREAGQAVVELALVLTLLLVLAIGVTDFAHGVSEYIQVVNAANTGAQFAAQGTGESTNTTAITSDTCNALGSLSCSGITVSSPTDDGSGESMKYVKVSVTVPYQMTMPFVGVFLPTINLSSSASFRVNSFNS